MTSPETKFEQLDRYIRSALSDSSSLAEAKVIWWEWIKSNRQMENIENIDDLLKLLKRRGIYHALEYNAFRVFKKVIHQASFHALVESYKLVIEQEVTCQKENRFGSIKNTLMDALLLYS